MDDAGAPVLALRLGDKTDVSLRNRRAGPKRPDQTRALRGVQVAQVAVSPAENVMPSKSIIATVFAALMLGASAPALTQTTDYQTYFTFSAPVTLPGVTLPAGKYLFRLADSSTSRKVINVVNADDKKSVAMLTTIPNRLSKAPSDPEVRFMEAPEGTPLPIKTWWYPGNSTGYEFIYPRHQALELSKVANEPVLTTNTETKDFGTAELTRVGRSGAAVSEPVNENPAPGEATGKAQRGEIPSAR